MKKKEEMRSLGPGDMGRGWAGARGWPPFPRSSLRVEEAQDGLRNGLWDQRCGIEVPGKTEEQEQLHPVGPLQPWLKPLGRSP